MLLWACVVTACVVVVAAGELNMYRKHRGIFVMNVKGSAFLARKHSLEPELGAQHWNDFMAKMVAEDSYFEAPILQTTLIPVQKFLNFNDALIKTFYRGDAYTYWIFGEKTGQHLFENGPYKNLWYSGNYERFVETLPRIWSTFYDHGVLSTVVDEQGVEVKISELPILHPYFEYTTMSFVKKGLELTGADITSHEVLKGFSKGDQQVHYRFFLSGELKTVSP